MCSNDESIVYADNTVLVYVGRILEKKLLIYVNNISRNLLKWCTCHKLLLKPLKSEIMVETIKRIKTVTYSVI